MTTFLIILAIIVLYIGCSCFNVYLLGRVGFRWGKQGGTEEALVFSTIFGPAGLFGIIVAASILRSYRRGKNHKKVISKRAVRKLKRKEALLKEALEHQRAIRELEKELG